MSGIRHAARQYQSVVIIGRDITHHVVYRKPLGLFEMFEPLNLSRQDAYQVNLRSRLPSRRNRLAQLNLLDPFSSQTATRFPLRCLDTFFPPLAVLSSGILCPKLVERVLGFVCFSTSARSERRARTQLENRRRTFNAFWHRLHAATDPCHP